MAEPAELHDTKTFEQSKDLYFPIFACFAPFAHACEANHLCLWSGTRLFLLKYQSDSRV